MVFLVTASVFMIGGLIFSYCCLKRKIEESEMNIVRRIKGMEEGLKEENKPRNNAPNHVDNTLSANAAEARQQDQSSPSNDLLK